MNTPAPKTSDKGKHTPVIRVVVSGYVPYDRADLKSIGEASAKIDAAVAELKKQPGIVFTEVETGMTTIETAKLKT